MALYTICPKCKKQFQLRADHLAAAGGIVRCGYCKKKFSALHHLRDQPRKLPKPRKQGRPVGQKNTGELEDPSYQEYEAQLVDLIERQQKLDPFYRGVWVVGTLFLAVLLVTQSVWHNRNHLYVRYPGLLSWTTSLCSSISCDPLRRGSLEHIRLISRDVRFHPIREQSLLVNATMKNTSGIYLPLPGLQLQLYSEEGEPIAYRYFSPVEYMHGDKRRIKVGMAPDEPVHVVLELAGNVDFVSGFEFGFVSAPGRG